MPTASSIQTPDRRDLSMDQRDFSMDSRDPSMDQRDPSVDQDGTLAPRMPPPWMAPEEGSSSVAIDHLRGDDEASCVDDAASCANEESSHAEGSPRGSEDGPPGSEDSDDSDDDSDKSENADSDDDHDRSDDEQATYSSDSLLSEDVADLLDANPWAQDTLALESSTSPAGRPGASVTTTCDDPAATPPDEPAATPPNAPAATPSTPTFWRHRDGPRAGRQPTASPDSRPRVSTASQLNAAYKIAPRLVPNRPAQSLAPIPASSTAPPPASSTAPPLASSTASPLNPAVPSALAPREDTSPQAIPRMPYRPSEGSDSQAPESSLDPDA